MYVDVCKSVSECVEQGYWKIYYNQSGARGTIATGEERKCV